MAEAKGTIRLPPGVTKIQSEYASGGRFIDMDKVRFLAGQAQKIGGWVSTGWPATDGTPRSALAWSDDSFNYNMITGTNRKIELTEYDGTKTDITPLEASGTLGTDPFTTTNTSVEVTVAHTSHGRAVGDVVVFAGASAVGGITIDGEYTVTEYVNANSYKIEHSAAATSSATGGGASVTYQYLLATQSSTTLTGGGYGLGGYGIGPYGEATSSTTYVIFPSHWSIDKYGEDIVAQRNSQTKVYYYDSSAGGRMTALSNSPAGDFCFVTTERIVVSLNTQGEGMRIQGSDDEDPNDWTPTVTNKSFDRRLKSGSRFVAGTVLGEGVNMLWSDTACFIMQWANNNTIVYDTRLIAPIGAGLCGPEAFTVVNGVAYWMTPADFRQFAGGVSEVPRADEIRDYVFGRINADAIYKVICRYDEVNDEVWWHYPANGADECDSYVAFNRTEQTWHVGTMARCCFATQTTLGSRIIGWDTSGDSYVHESGTDADGSPLVWHWETGWVDINDGNTIMDVFGFIPDFERHVGQITLTLTSRDKPAETSDTETYSGTIDVGEGIEDLRMSGRQVKMRMESDAINSDFRLGRMRLITGAGGARR